MQPSFDYMGLPDFAKWMGRSRQHTHRMQRNGILAECGYDVRRIKSKNGSPRLRIMVGIPRSSKYVTNCHCPDCGAKWDQENAIPTECKSCKSTNIETRKAA